MKTKLLLVIILLVALVAGRAFADVPLETAAGVIITADGTACNLNYTDGGGVSNPQVTTTSINTVVAAMYGFDLLANLPDWNYTTAGKGLTYNYIVTNESNTYSPCSVKYYVTPIGPSGFNGTNWTVSITEEGGYSYLSYTGPFSGTYTSLAHSLTNGANQNKNMRDNVYLNVTPSSNASESPDGSYLVVTLEVYASLTPAGVYFGANSITYGGTSDSTDLTDTCIHTSVMTMTRVTTVDAPRTASGQYTGGAHDAVPGAVVTFTMSVSDEGSVSAQNVQIIDKVPYVGGSMTTWLCHVGAGLGFQGSVPNVTITAPSPDATGWRSYYSIYSTPMTDYGYIGPQWVTVDAWPAYINSSQAMWVKFEKDTVTPAEGTKKINWGVTIR
jgi:hypothetical protein